MNFIASRIQDLLVDTEGLFHPLVKGFFEGMNTAITLAYERGLLDGFLLGCVLAMLMILPNKGRPNG